ncbi:hypothetical protein [Lysobacter sp. P5_B9]
MTELLLLALATASPPGQELSLGSIVLGQSEASVVELLGQPQSRTEGGSDYLPTKLSYPGFTVLLDEQGVGGLISTNGKFCTPAGACPGMAYAKVQRIYGAALVTELIKGSPVGYVYGEGCWLEFTQKAGKVQTIEVACSP